ncbi:MAG TPA: hypothetical protein VG651_02955 [Stellaceae bacterium]|nr:hypothetical protein [Stellaceae bacterium]
MSTRRQPPPAGVGAVIMAGGIFAAAALPQLPDGALLTAPFALVLALGWLGIAGLILRSTLQRGLGHYTGPLIGSFAIGTWVAASAVVARMAMLAAPDARWLAETMFAATAGIWLWFLPQALRNLVRIARSPPGEARPNGVILLTTVATQAVALPALRLFPDVAVVRGVADALMGLGLVCYLAGAVLIARRYLDGPRWRLATDWDNTNCILHGALSISGLTMTVGGAIGPDVLVPYWAATLAVFVVIETVELARLAARVRSLGWREAVLVYDLSQWARNFTFGMFYAFTAALVGNGRLGAGFGVLPLLADAVLAFGQYVVLLLLLVELALMARCFAGRAVGATA